MDTGTRIDTVPHFHYSVTTRSPSLHALCALQQLITTINKEPITLHRAWWPRTPLDFRGWHKLTSELMVFRENN